MIFDDFLHKNIKWFNWKKKKKPLRKFIVLLERERALIGYDILQALFNGIVVQLKGGTWLKRQRICTRKVGKAV